MAFVEHDICTLCIIVQNSVTAIVAEGGGGLEVKFHAPLDNLGPEVGAVMHI